MFSKACEYAIRSVLFVMVKSSREGKRVRVKEIAKEIDAPEAFTAKVLQKLVKENLLQSSTGPKGGFYIDDEDLKSLKLADIVKAIDGDGIFVSCALGLPSCDPDHPCPVHHRFGEIRDGLQKMLSDLNMEMLIEGIDKENMFLKY